MESFHMKDQKWRFVATTPVTFVKIGKERCAHGFPYLIQNRRTVWISQSIPAICVMIGRLDHVRIHPSSLYRSLRGELNSFPKGWQILRFCRDQLEEVNEIIRGDNAMFVCTKDLDYWFIEEPLKPVSHENIPL